MNPAKGKLIITLNWCGHEVSVLFTTWIRPVNQGYFTGSLKAIYEEGLIAVP
ncbi:MAG: hypothetical protein HXX16_12370 [Bacteroidales bacterium]|nr:hypothetical protein [Bacteroidales bacterium]